MAFNSLGNLLVACVGGFHLSSFRVMSNRMNASVQISGLRTPIRLSAEDASPQQPRRLEVVSKQATKVTAISTRLEWKIDQFEKLMKLFKNGHNLISKQFGCPQAPTVTWELHVYPNGKREEDVGNVSFFLRQVGLQRGEDPIMTEFQIYALDANSLRVSVCRDTKDFTNQQGRGKFQVSRDKMMAALKADGALLLICEVEYFPPGSKISVEQAVEAEPLDDFDEKNEVSIRDSLKDMLDSELFADCTIKVGNKTLKAHRCILGQHSEVFRSMFAQESMLEAQKGIIDIQDSRFEPVRAMVDYIYTGSTDLVEGYAEDVLAIADKYAILPLKEQCERYLSTTINCKNVASTAVFADTYSASILKQACTKYMSLHHRDVLRSAEWKQMKRERSELANDLLESVLVGDGVANPGDFSFSGSDESTSTGSGNVLVNDNRPPLRKRVRRAAIR
ncbi:BTB/POZ domain-containing protein [Wuchereria bancrofti]|uniref:BTB/POZ domain-containing protein n=3 Tax=Wuchereria bancrofti TaxID=6293 RepID=J9BH25_WUCBA|nr:BTB/POZ domain-containing protein [Wuchereria bancrofti]